MSKVRIYGDTSGYVDIAVPAVAGTTTLNLDKIPQADISGNIAMDTNTLFVDAANNRVGIGTTSPSDDLEINPSADEKGITLKTTSSIRPYLNFDANRSGANQQVGRIQGKWNGTTITRIEMVGGSDTTNKDDGYITFQTASSASDLNERMRIDSSGRLGIATGGTVNTNAHANADDLVIGNTSNRTGMTIVSATDSNGNIHFSDGTSSGNANIKGQISYEHTDDSFRFYINSATLALKLGSSGGTVFNNGQDINQNFAVKASGNANALFIDGNGGNVGFGASNNSSYDSNAQNLLLASSGNTGMTIRSAGSTPFAMIHFADGVSNNDEKRAGRIIYQHDGNNLTLHTANTERLRITGSGDFGIGETSPANILHIKTSAGGGPQIELDSTSGTANSGFIGFDGTSLQLATQRDMVDGSKRDTAKSWGGINIVGAAAGSYIQLQTSEGNNNNASTRMTINSSGLVEVASYLKSKKGTIQTVVNQPTIYASINPVQVWAEASSSFRVSITPRFASGTKILGTYSIPINPTGASNILMAIQPWYSTNGGTTKTVLNQGGPYGSRITGSHAWFRSSNGYDVNDMQNHVVHFGFTPGATTTMTWGFYFRSEAGNTTYFCSSQGNSSLWGWTAPVYMELREVEIA